ncbi:MAG: bifunctional folylpolyglutamate synthase/dihydrofolate synthase [Paracoccaceae bacterium]
MKEGIKNILNEFPKRLGLNKIRILKLLNKLGNPHKCLPPVIHIAGTNGKGSTSAFIKAGLESRGDKVHVFTSPHLINITERILIAGEQIDKKYFNFLLNKCIEANGKDELSFFELITTVAFLAFSENKAQWTILEVGLGGRLDCTNVIENPYLSIITPISMDHHEFLGNSIKKIALEKGGIIKKNSKVIISKQHKSALKVLKKIADNFNCKTSIYGNDFESKHYNNSFLFYTKRRKLLLPLPFLKGTHQIENATVSMAALIKLKCRKKNLVASLKNVSWPGRLQKIEKGKLIPRDLEMNGKIFIDGGHNISAGIALSKWIKNLKQGKFFIIVGMMNNKDIEGFIKPLKPYIYKLFAIKIPQQKNAYDSQHIAEKSKALGINSQVAGSLEKALKIVSEDQPSLPKRILITGSLYLVGYFLEKNK